jgi:hypothetical protein
LAQYKDFTTIASEAGITAKSLRDFLEGARLPTCASNQNTEHALKQWWLKRNGGVELGTHVPNESQWAHLDKKATYQEYYADFCQKAGLQGNPHGYIADPQLTEAAAMQFSSKYHEHLGTKEDFERERHLLRRLVTHVLAQCKVSKLGFDEVLLLVFGHVKERNNFYGRMGKEFEVLSVMCPMHFPKSTTGENWRPRIVFFGEITSQMANGKSKWCDFEHMGRKNAEGDEVSMNFDLQMAIGEVWGLELLQQGWGGYYEPAHGSHSVDLATDMGLNESMLVLRQARADGPMCGYDKIMDMAQHTSNGHNLPHVLRMTPHVSNGSVPQPHEPTVRCPRHRCMYNLCTGFTAKHEVL